MTLITDDLNIENLDQLKFSRDCILLIRLLSADIERVKKTRRRIEDYLRKLMGEEQLAVIAKLSILLNIIPEESEAISPGMVR